MQDKEIAARLATAWRTRQALPAEAELAALRDANIGGAIQSELHALFLDAGRKPIGWKLGLTSQVALDMFGAEAPMVGIIYADSMLEDGANLSPNRTLSPRIEGEILLEIGSMPPSGASDAELIASLTSVSAAFEIADSRILGWPSAIGGATADNACCGWLMRAPQSINPADADFEGTGMVITCNGEGVSEGRASACLGSVLEVYRWFVEDSHSCGRVLSPGEIVLTGAMGPAMPMNEPATYQLDCPGLGAATLLYRDGA